MGLLERVADARRPLTTANEQRFSIDNWLTNYLFPAYGFSLPLTQTYGRGAIEKVAETLPGYTAIIKQCPPAFAAEMVRALVISQARFVFRNRLSSSSPRRTFGKPSLARLERPWRNGTSGELLARMEWHAGLAGNAFVTTRFPGRLRVLRPDWVKVVYGSELEPDDAGHAIDGELIGYVYQNGGFSSPNDPITLLPDEVAHWSPLPDPESPGMGMAWISPALREMQGDRAATEHKLKFFENGATPNLVISGIAAPPGETLDKEQFDKIVEMLDAQHSGLGNAYKTLYLTAGADATIVGSSLKEMDFKATQGAGETRISVLARVPAPLLGLSEGLAGSSLNAGNFGMTRRMFADTWVYPTLQDICAALSPLVDVPSDAELWFDTTDIPLLREDGKDAAEIEKTKAGTIRQLIDAGYKPDSVVAAVMGNDFSKLVHTGLFSVQLQPPGTPMSGNGNPAPGNQGGSGDGSNAKAS